MKFEKNRELEYGLSLLNELLDAPEQEIIGRQSGDPESKKHPTILKIGCSRSGGTLFTQWALSTGIVAVPTNFISRFYRAPTIGALIFEIVTNPKYGYRDEFSDVARSVPFQSDLGKTKGFASPHDFWYFWRDHFNFPDTPVNNDTFVVNANFDRFDRELASIQAIFGKPLLLKAHIANPYVALFCHRLSNCVFIHTIRDLLDTAVSILASRIRWHGSMEKWFSFRPRGFEPFQHADPYTQVAAQVYLTEKEILLQREALGERYLCTSYEDLCADPATLYERILAFINRFSEAPITRPYEGPRLFTPSPGHKDIDHGRLRLALDTIISEFGDLPYDCPVG